MNLRRFWGRHRREIVIWVVICFATILIPHLTNLGAESFAVQGRKFPSWLKRLLFASGLIRMLQIPIIVGSAVLLIVLSVLGHADQTTNRLS